MLVTLVTFKSFLGSTSLDDTILGTILNNAQSVVERYIWRKLEEVSYTDKVFDWHGEQIFQLPQYPVTELTKFQYRTGTTWSDVTDEYYLNGDTGEVRLPCTIIPRGFSIVRASFKAWYTTATLPNDLLQAILDIASMIVNKKGSEWIKREKIDGSELEFSDATMSASTQSILSSYCSYNV